MLLGKRSRPPMKRTTSMTEFTMNLNSNGEAQQSDLQNPFQAGQFGPAEGLLDPQYLASAISTRIHRHNSADFVETAHFLRSCSLCNRRLVSDRDIYMYRGDSAFCSLECRQQQMNQDERKENCSVASKKLQASSKVQESKVSIKGETVTAM